MGVGAAPSPTQPPATDRPHKTRLPPPQVAADESDWLRVAMLDAGNEREWALEARREGCRFEGEGVGATSPHTLPRRPHTPHETLIR